MKKKRMHLDIIIPLILGFAILLYPWFSNSWNEWRAEKLIVAQRKSVDALKETKKDEMFKAAEEYNKQLVGSIVPNVFAIREGVLNREYESLLNISNNGIIGEIIIPSINVNLPIYHYTNSKVLGKGCGHLYGSSLPSGGKSTHTVLSAHRGLPAAKMFTDLNLVEIGDTFYIDVLGERHAYEVELIKVVEPENTKSLAIKKDKDLVTLVTCTPYGINTKRLLVRGHRIPYSECGFKGEKVKKRKNWKAFVGKTICVVFGFIIAYLIQKMKIPRKKGKNEKKE